MKCRHPKSSRRSTREGSATRVECLRCGKVALDEGSGPTLKWTAPQAVRAASAALGKRALEEGELELAQVKGLPGRLTATDREILLAAWDAPLDVEAAERPHSHPPEVYSAHEILWLIFHKLLSVWVDGADRVWVRTTALGQQCVQPGVKRRRRKDAA